MHEIKIWLCAKNAGGAYAQGVGGWGGGAIFGTLLYM